MARMNAENKNEPMKITNIKVTAGRTFNHPHESYSNLRPEVELRADVQDGDDTAFCVRQLQAAAEQMVEDHKNGLLKSIEELHQLTEHQAEVRGLQLTLTQAQERMEQIRKQHPELKLIGDGV